MELTWKQQWFGNIRADVLSGIVIALALIPESLAFSIIVGVDPMIGLYASMVMAIVIAFAGGRPGMISAATGAMALVLAPLVRDYGVEYLFAVTILTGIVQITFSLLGVTKLMRFVPNSVMMGFVNALGILIFITQVPHFLGEGWATYLYIGLTLVMVYVIPKFFTLIPAPLIAIISLTVAAMWSGVEMKTIGDAGTLSATLPSLLMPNVPWTWETLWILLPYAVALSIVGLLETLLTASVLDDITETKSSKKREAFGQGVANIVNGFFGGMAGCALIGQSVMNMQNGGRGRLSTFTAGVTLVIFVLVLGQYVMLVPMPILVGVMLTVAAATFNWQTFRFVRHAPLSETFVLLLTMVVTIWTQNLAFGVVSGVLVSALVFVANISKVRVTKKGDRWFVEGPLFFASTTPFLQQVEKIEDVDEVVLDFSNSHLWDESAVASLVKAETILERKDISVKVVGLNEKSRQLYDKLLLND